MSVPRRDQVRMLTASLDELLDREHRVRLVWQYAESLDLSELYEAIQVTPHTTGRPAIDPRLLFALWLFATIEGVGSARQLARLTERDLPYQWLCGEVSVNYHRLSDFRTAHGDLLEHLMIGSIGVLLHQELITLETVAQDGMRVRASAGAGRFLGEEGLERALAQARAHVAGVRAEQEEDPSGDESRRRAARQRAAEDRLQRVLAARENLQQIQQQHDERRDQKKSTPKACTSDPEARRMRMGDQGFRPAYNVQFVTDGDSRLIVGVQVTNQGSDCGLMAPLHARLCHQYALTPKNYLVDGPFATIDDVTLVEQRGSQVHAPLNREQQQLEAGHDPYHRKKRDTDEMAAFRRRMGTEQGRQVRRRRASIAEFPNAGCRNRRLHQFAVRGLKKVKAQTLWHALAHNFHRLLHQNWLSALKPP